MCEKNDAFGKLLSLLCCFTCLRPSGGDIPGNTPCCGQHLVHKTHGEAETSGWQSVPGVWTWVKKKKKKLFLIVVVGWTQNTFWGTNFQTHTLSWECFGLLRIGYRLRWRSDIWRTDRGVAEVRSPDIRPATEDDIRHNAPGLLEMVDQLLRTKVRRKLLNQDKPSRLASYALQQHKAKSARLAASEFYFLLAVLRRCRWVRAVEQAWDENLETSASDGRAW